MILKRFLMKSKTIKNNDLLKYYTDLYKKLVSYNVCSWILASLMIISLVLAIILSIVLNTVILHVSGRVGLFSVLFGVSFVNLIFINQINNEIKRLKSVIFKNQELETLKNEVINSSYFRRSGKLIKLCKKARGVYYYDSNKK